MGMPEGKHHDVYPEIDPRSTLQGAATGLHVAITGASRGCGRCMAIAFAQAGAEQIFLFGRDQKSLADTARLAGEAEHACELFTYSLDLTKDNVNEPFRLMLKDARGRVDVLINNAGVLENWKPLDDSDPAEWWRTYEVNVRGTYLGVKAVLPSMLKQGKGTIINLSSAGGLVTRPGASAYQMTKTDFIRFTAFLDADHGQSDIRAFALHPGGVKTDLAFCMPEYMHKILVDSPELSGAVCVYLSTKDADFLRGRYVSAQWDLPELAKRKDEILEKDLFKMQLRVE